jgi:hypothetical protein
MRTIRGLETSNEPSILTAIIEAILIEHFGDGWLSPEEHLALRKTVMKVAQQKTRKPSEPTGRSIQRLKSLDAPLAVGEQNLLLTNDQDVTDFNRTLAGSKYEQSAIESQPANQ